MPIGEKIEDLEKGLNTLERAILDNALGLMRNKASNAMVLEYLRTSMESIEVRRQELTDLRMRHMDTTEGE